MLITPADELFLLVLFVAVTAVLIVFRAKQGFVRIFFALIAGVGGAFLIQKYEHVSFLLPSSDKKILVLRKEMHTQHRRGNREAALQTAEKILELTDGQYDRLSYHHVEAVHDVGWLNWNLGRLPAAEKYLRRSLALYLERNQLNSALPSEQRTQGPGVHGAGNEQYLLGHICEATGRKQEAVEFYLAAAEHYRGKEKHRWYLKSILGSLQRVYLRTGRRAEAAVIGEELSALARKNSKE